MNEIKRMQHAVAKAAHEHASKNSKIDGDKREDEVLIDAMLREHFRAEPGLLVREKAIMEAYDTLKHALVGRGSDVRRLAQLAVSSLVCQARGAENKSLFKANKNR